MAAAEKVFGENGYDRASIVDITREAGVAQGTFYVYFPNKLDLFRELVEELGNRLRRRLAESVASVDTRAGAERAGLHAFLEFVREHRNLYRIIREAEFVDEAIYRRYYERFAKDYQKGLKLAMRRGEVAKLDPEVITYVMMGIFDFIGMRWVLWEGKLPTKRILEDVFSFIDRGLNAEPIKKP